MTPGPKSTGLGAGFTHPRPVCRIDRSRKRDASPRRQRPSASLRPRRAAAKKEGPERGLLPITSGSTLRVLCAALLLVLIVLAWILAGTFAVLLFLSLLVPLAGIAVLARLTGLALRMVAHLRTSCLIRIEAIRISRSCASSG